MDVHNHGPEEGEGLDCPELKIGKCQLEAIKMQAYERGRVDEYEVLRKAGMLKNKLYIRA